VRWGTNESDLWGFIDEKGQTAIPAKFTDVLRLEGDDDVIFIGGFADGLAAVQFGGTTDSTWGFIDTHGQVAIRPQFSQVDQFSFGLATVRVGGVNGGRWGYIDKTGALTITPTFDTSFSFSDNGLAIVLQQGKVEYIDRHGSIVIPRSWDDGYAFSEGLACVRNAGPGAIAVGPSDYRWPHDSMGFSERYRPGDSS
jgi:hypothetical protein